MSNNCNEYGWRLEGAGCTVLARGVNYQNHSVNTFESVAQIWADSLADSAINTTVKSLYNWADSGAVIGFILVNESGLPVRNFTEAVYQLVYTKRAGDGLREFSRTRPVRKIRTDKGKKRATK